MDRVQFTKMMSSAGHIGTDDNTALSAIRKAHAMLMAEGMDFSNVRFSPNDPFALPDPPRLDSAPSFTAREIEHEKTKATNANLVKENARLTAEVERLGRALDYATALKSKKNEDGSIAFAKFEQNAIAKFTKRNGWKRAFADFSGFSENSIQSWQKAKIAPAEAVARLAGFSKECGIDDPAGDTWTLDEDASLGNPEYAGKSESAMETLLTKKFGRKISLGAVKKASQRNRARAVIVKCYKDGMTNEADILTELRAVMVPGSGGLSGRFVTRVLDHTFEERKRLDTGRKWASQAEQGIEPGVPSPEQPQPASATA